MTDMAKTSCHSRTILIFFGCFIILLVILAIILSQRAVYAAPDQPIDFSHKKHDESGVQCLFCHPNVTRSDLAGIPSVERCVGCHRVIATESEEIQKVLGYWERQEPIPWEQVVEMADHVFFSHSPHYNGGVSCETCHGAVGAMEVTHAAKNMDMGWCLECHLDQPKENIVWLSDCLLCHE
jgi:hypothetical protein